MAFDTTWFTFEVQLDSGDTLEDKIPADSEADARATIRRVYPNAIGVRLLEKKTRPNRFATFDPSTASRRISTSKPAPAHRFNCPACHGSISLPESPPSYPLSCPHCGWAFQATSSGKSVILVQPLASPPTAPDSPEEAARPWHEVLEVDMGADLKAIRRAYLEQIRLYHPDKAAHLGPALIALAEQKTAEANLALQQALKARK